ncbi:MAG: DUF3108 domain-containing protein [Acidobacteria bacterium]|nr:DUF3108 domain-containing protein [Acidobacteriota bacterium]
MRASSHGVGQVIGGMLVLAIALAGAFRAVTSPRAAGIPPSTILEAPEVNLRAVAVDGRPVPTLPPAVPVSVAAAPPAAGTAPPVSRVGRLPFGEGEEVRYRILWKAGGDVALPAGDAVFTADSLPAREAGGPSGYRFELVVETAAWISGFFVAHDRFWSVTGPDLLPTLHVQEIREGRKAEHRAVTFDARAQRVVVASGPPDAVRDGVEFPLVPGARDALTAFYQARVATLEAGHEVRIQVHNVGREFVLTLGGLKDVTLMAEGTAQRALRLDARVLGTDAETQNPSAIVWLSADARRVPLLIEISAAFGAVRVELAGYRAGPAARGR